MHKAVVTYSMVLVTERETGVVLVFAIAKKCRKAEEGNVGTS